VVHCNGFRGDEYRLDVLGKHMPSDRPCGRTVSYGPSRRCAAVRRDGRCSAHRVGHDVLSGKRSISEALRASTEHRSSHALADQKTGRLDEAPRSEIQAVRGWRLFGGELLFGSCGED